MNYFLSIISILVLLLLFTRILNTKMWAIKLKPHTETPDKYGISFEEVRFPTENKGSLYGWWIPAKIQPETSATLILVHGWNRNLGRMLRYIQHMHPFNYNLLAFDARHHGSSDAHGHASMYKFAQDTAAAVKYAGSRQIDPDKIGVLGLSIGGAGSIYATVLAPQIKAVVTIGAPAHPVDVMEHTFRLKHIPGPLIWFMLKQIERRIGIKYELFAPVNNIGKSDSAFFIIQGVEDKVVLADQGEKLKNAAKPDHVKYWAIPGRGHSDCHHEPGFWDKLHAFYQTQFEKGSKTL